MPAKDFFDTAVLIYAVAKNDLRGAQAEALLASGARISVQPLNELIAVARRKLGMPRKEIKEFRRSHFAFCAPTRSPFRLIHTEMLWPLPKNTDTASTMR
jgi:predicted nucleic acid-binding protein